MNLYVLITWWNWLSFDKLLENMRKSAIPIVKFDHANNQGEHEEKEEGEYDQTDYHQKICACLVKNACL